MNQKVITIAIAEDHKLMGEMIARTLTQMGFNIMNVSKNGKELLSHLATAEELPDVCLLDINMPGMKGYEVAKVMRGLYPKIKVAALTTSTDMEDLIIMLKNGGGSFLSKNADPVEWKTAIYGLFERGYHCTEWMANTMLRYIRLDEKLV